MASKMTKRYWWYVVAVGLIIIFLGKWYWNDSQSTVYLQPKGKAIFFRGGFFHRDKFELVISHGTWFFFDKNECVFGCELIVPFESHYNETRILRLEPGGKVFVLDKKAMSRYELRIVNGEWSYDADSHWQSIFDLHIE